MVVHAHQADGGVVGDEHAGVEGQAVQQCLGQQAVAVQQPHQPRRQTGEQRNLQHGGGQLYRKAGGFRPAVFLNHVLNARADVVDGVGGIEKDLDGVFLDAAVVGVHQQREAGGELPAVVELLVHDEAVHFRHLRHAAHKAGDEDFHKGDFYAFPALFGDVAHQGFVFHIVVQKNLRVAAHGHEVRGDLHDGVHIAHTAAFGAVSKHGVPSFP